MVLAGFADDFSREILGANHPGTVVEKLGIGSRPENSAVDKGMGEVGAAQNISNHEDVAYLRGDGAH
eukprot:3551647-Pyramimonas_sp.AAC.1